jgi:ComF family protein
MDLKQRFFSMFDLASKIFSPPICSCCKQFLHERSVFCNSCDKKISPIISLPLKITQSRQMRIMAVCEYKEPVRSLILAKRYRNCLSSNQLAQLIWEKTFLKNMEYDLLVPVPLHWTRSAKRGFNQANVMANYLSKKSGVAVVNLVKRCRQTGYQAGLSAEKRYENVKDSFVLCDKKEEYKGKKIVIIDDLVTTGATIRAVAKSLLPLKPKSIIAVVAARVV